MYLDYLRTDDFTFQQYKEEILLLFKEAGLKDFFVFHQEFLGFGNFANVRLPGFANLTNRREDIVLNIQRCFNEAIGVFRKRFKDAFNPIFWIEFIIKLPQYFFEFFGVIPEKVIVKVFLVIYWLIALVFGLKSFNIIDYLIK